MIILERIKGDTAVLYDDDKEIKVDSSLVKNCSTGDVIIFRDGCFVTDDEATEQRRIKIIKLQNSLFE